MRLVLALSIAMAWPGSAQADWLELLPDCAYGPEARSLGHTALLYPRAGFPAVVEAGDSLVVRIRVPSALTPPPGIQQDRALVGWDARLYGQSTSLAEPSEHAYPLRVVDVRPDGGSSLVYRATIRVPAYAAPGTYGLFVDAPGGDDSVAASVRIVDAGAAVNVVAFDRPQRPDAERAGADEIEAARALLRTLASTDVDVWVTRRTPALVAALSLLRVDDDGRWPAVLLLPEAGLSAVLRSGGRAYVSGGCESQHVPFDDRVDGVLRRTGLEREPLPALPPSGARGWNGSDHPLPTSASVTVGTTEPLTIEVAPGHGGPAIVDVRFPVGDRSLVVDGASVRFHPATVVGSPGQPPSVLARVEVPAGGRATIRRGDRRPFELSLEASADRVTTHQRVAINARGADLSTVAWRLGEDDTDVGEVVHRTFGILGPQRVSALGLATDGRAAPAQLEITVETHEDTGCDGCGAAGGTPVPLGIGLVALLLLQRRHRRNIPPPRSRWTA